MGSARPKLKELIMEELRTTIDNTLSSVIHEVTEEELRAALKEPSFTEPLANVIRLVWQHAIEELRPA